MKYHRNKPTLCPSCRADVRLARSSFFRCPLPPYCERCGWDLENARKSIKRMLWPVLLFLPAYVAAVWLAARFGWLSDAAWVGLLWPSLFLCCWMVIPALRELYRMRALTFDGRAPVDSRPEVSATQKAIVARILRLNRPRKVHIPMRIWIAVAFLLYVILVNSSKALSDLTNAWRTSDFASFDALFALMFPVLFVTLVFLVARHARHWLLLSFGIATEGVIRDMETAGPKERFFYSFRDGSGRQWLHKLPAPNSIVYEGMPVAVFYNSRNPARNLTLENSQLDLVISTDTRPLIAILRRP